MTHEPDQHGLDLFDQNASAVRGFPNAMLGYDKKAVDEYIRDLERQLSLAKHQMREVQRELTAANLRVDDTDFSKLGAHTANLLKVAEAQAGRARRQRAQAGPRRCWSEARRKSEVERRRAPRPPRPPRRRRQEGIASLKGLRDRPGAPDRPRARRRPHRGPGPPRGRRPAPRPVPGRCRAAGRRPARQARREAGPPSAPAAEREAAEARAEPRASASRPWPPSDRARVAPTEQMTAATPRRAPLRGRLLTALDQRPAEDLRSGQQAAYAEAEDIKADAIAEAAAHRGEARAPTPMRSCAETDAELVARNEQLKRDNRHLRRAQAGAAHPVGAAVVIGNGDGERVPRGRADRPDPILPRRDARCRSPTSRRRPRTWRPPTRSRGHDHRDEPRGSAGRRRPTARSRRSRRRRRERPPTRGPERETTAPAPNVRPAPGRFPQVPPGTGRCGGAAPREPLTPPDPTPSRLALAAAANRPHQPAVPLAVPDRLPADPGRHGGVRHLLGAGRGAAERPDPRRPGPVPRAGAQPAGRVAAPANGRPARRWRS